MRRVLAAAVIILAVASRAAAATSYYVNASTGNDGFNGMAGTPFKTITHAMSVAVSGDTIFVAAGNYNPSLGETFPIDMKSGVQLIGAGPASTRIDAVQTNRVLTCFGGSATTLIQGFTITGGQFIQTSIGANAYGGGIYCDNSDQTVITRNLISGNVVIGYTGASNGGSGGYSLGGGIYVGSGTTTIVNNVISLNKAQGGQGYIAFGSNINAGKGGDATGGAIATFGNPIIRNNTIVKNRAVGGDAGASGGGGNGANGGDGNSGAISGNNATIINNVITDNVSQGGAAGGGAGGTGSPGTGTNGGISGFGTIDHNLIYNNTPSTGGSNGTNVVTSDPLYYSSAAENYHIPSASPARAAGTATNAPATDYDGVPRPNPPSIGAFEATLTTHFSVSAPANATPGTPFNVTVTAQTAGNATDANYVGTVHITSSDGSATLPSNYSYGLSDGGVHTFSVTLQTSGTQSITASDLYAVSITGTTNVTVSGGIAAPANLVATASSTTNVDLTWNTVANANHYEVWRKSAVEDYTMKAQPASASYSDTTVTSGKAYVYKVLAVDGSNNHSAFSTPDAATTVTFTDTSIGTGTTLVKAVHISDLRTAIDALRALTNLGNGTYTDNSLSGVTIKAVHITDLRTALNAARTALSLPALSYTDTTLNAQSTIIKSAHITDLRSGVK